MNNNQKKAAPGDGVVLYTDYRDRYPQAPLKLVLTRDGTVFPFTHKNRGVERPVPPRGFSWNDTTLPEIHRTTYSFQNAAWSADSLQFNDNEILAEYDPVKGLIINDKMCEFSPRVLGVKFEGEDRVTLTAGGREVTYDLQEVRTAVQKPRATLAARPV